MVVFTVDAFSALYSVICMRGTNSLKMVVATVSINITAMVLSLHGMNRRSRVARESRSFYLLQLLQRQAQRSPSFLTSSSTGGSPELLSALVLTTVKLLQTPGQLDPSELRHIRLLSGRQHKASNANTTLLQSLAARCVYHNNRRVAETISMGQMKSRYASATIEGRALCTSCFTAPMVPRSRFALRLRAALLAIPDAGRKFGSELRSGLTIFPGSRSASCEESSKSIDTDSGQASNPRLFLMPRLADFVKVSSWLLLERMTSSTPLPVQTTAMTIDTTAELRSLVILGRPLIGDVLVEMRKKNTRAVKQTLQLLFNNEYLGLTAYTLFIIPMLYVLYMPILQSLRNEVYYPTHFVLLENADQFLDRMTVIAILAFLQLAVLIVLHVFVATRFAISTIYQIAFVLETHFTLVGGRLLVSFIFAVQTTLLHYGTICSIVVK
ncbi:unnamed protein product [Phytophthora fragariaefolia]|uniref:Unnamed protein product n=1 Tax=Phytophthora fragariaefolia TaxID=1490495 RepID=A0A9W6XHZ3_9STRA|nr:unnamed protein product [Phytophthora fragariaefolia]